MNALLAQFIPEARDLIEQAGSGLLTLERDAASPVAINDVFRAVHTLKGSSGLFDLAPLTRLVHAAEDLLGEVRTGEIALNADMVDRLLDSLDLVGGWIDALETDEALPADAEAKMAGRVALLRDWLARKPGAVAGAVRGADTGFGMDAFDQAPDWLAEFPESERLDAWRAASGERLLAWSFVPEPDCFFRGDDPVAMVRSSPGLLAVRVLPQGAMPDLASLDPLACFLRFELLSDVARDSLEEHMRYVAEQVDIRTIARSDLARHQAPAADPAVTREKAPDAADGFGSLARRLALEQLAVLETPANPGIIEGRLDSVGSVLKNLLKAVTGDDGAGAVDAAVAQWRSGDPAALRRIAGGIGGGDRMPAAPISPVEPRLAAVEQPCTPTLAPMPETAPAESAGDAKVANRILRVDQSKIDAIMNLVAELIVAKNGLSYLASRAEQVHGARAVAREIKDQFAVIDRITQGLQVGVMSVRMMPVSQVFQRFPRLVRDVARKLGKQIELVIEGEETEADKNVLESLADPLIHMVRNSLDHGIETPAERRAAGKPEQGVVRITAHQENDFVIIEVRDDGKGIDAGKVKSKALKLGLISAERAAQMSDDEAANLVFLAGFSTKDEVSDLSGRGVGMDVVRTAVVKAGGDVALRTALGKGTSVSLRLPLTMAVTRIVMIECQGRLFGIPMDCVAETVRIGKGQIRRIKTTETFVLRNTIVPIVRLAAVMGLPSQADAAPDKEEAVMVVKLGQDRIGLIVDSFRERMEVIVKPLEGILEGLPGFSGTALLGDGRVLLILDLKGIL